MKKALLLALLLTACQMPHTNTLQDRAQRKVEENILNDPNGFKEYQHMEYSKLDSVFLFENLEKKNQYFIDSLNFAVTESVEKNFQSASIASGETPPEPMDHTQEKKKLEEEKKAIVSTKPIKYYIIYDKFKETDTLGNLVVSVRKYEFDTLLNMMSCRYSNKF